MGRKFHAVNFLPIFCCILLAFLKLIIFNCENGLKKVCSFSESCVLTLKNEIDIIKTVNLQW